MNRQSKISNAVSAALSAFALAAMLGVGSTASAAVLTYDADTTPPVNDGTGVWNTTTANWFDGTTDVVWPNTSADTAIFGSGGTIANAAAGTVTVSAVNAGAIQFNSTVTTGYLLTGGTITLGNGTAGSAVVTGNSTLANTINSVIAGTSGLAFTGTGTVNVTLGGNSTYTGVTTLGATGRLGFSNVNAFGSSAGASATTLGTNYTQVTSGGAVQSNITGATTEAFLLNGNGGSSTTGAIRINGAPTFNSLVQLGSTSQLFNNGGGAVTFNGTVDIANFTLNLNTFSGAGATVGGIVQASNTGMTFNGPVTGTTGLVSIQGSGAGYFFNGTNTYTGNMSVTGSFLGGTGSINSNLTTITSQVTGANTNTVGTLTFTKALTINGSDLADLTATSSDTLAVGTTLTLGAASFLRLQGTTGAASYTLATFTTLVGTFPAANIFFNGTAGLPSGYALNYNANSITLDSTNVPEPVAMSALAVGGVLALRRRRSVSF